MTEELPQYLVKTDKEPDFYTLRFPTHSVEIHNTFAEMYHNNEIADSVLDEPPLFF